MVSKKVELYAHQLDAVKRLHSGAVLAGKVGSGKTLAALQYYKEVYSKTLELIVITTAKKRNDGDWVTEAGLLDLEEPTVDSWNNIDSYVNRRGFFIFDEQHASGSGKWAKKFIKIAKANKWIMLSATPGDRWIDYIPVFIANGMVKDKTTFNNEYVVYNPNTPFPQILYYRNTFELEGMRKAILVVMPDKRDTQRHRKNVITEYDRFLYDEVQKTRFNPFIKKPIKNKSEYTQIMRKLVSTSPARIFEFGDLVTRFDRSIVFYNYDYELDIITRVLKEKGINIFTYNGKHHDPSPTDGTWCYVVQYSAAEAWNNISTNRMIFYSPNYSYKVVEQCEGRIDRINTSFKNLYYYTLVSDAPIDKAVIKANKEKKVFNAAIWSE